MLLGFPRPRNLSGVWFVDETQSDPLDEFFKGMGIAWPIRKILLSVRSKTTINHSTRELVITAESSLGKSTTAYRLDGTETEEKGVDGTICKSHVYIEGNVIVVSTRYEGKPFRTRTTRRLIGDRVMEEIVELRCPQQPLIQARRIYTQSQIIKPSQRPQSLTIESQETNHTREVVESPMSAQDRWKAWKKQMRKHWIKWAPYLNAYSSVVALVFVILLIIMLLLIMGIYSALILPSSLWFVEHHRTKVLEKIRKQQ